MTAKELERSLFNIKFQKAGIVVPNYCGHGVDGEADLAVLRESLWLDEFEIKVSKSDFRREFKSKSLKHMYYQGDFGPCWHAIVRHYWFAMPCELALEVIDEVPDLYGVIQIDDWNHPNVLKKPTPLPIALKADARVVMHLGRALAARFWWQRIRASSKS